MNVRQRAVITRARRDAITVVSGPPGTGKSHTAAALDVDEVGRRRSVLIATQSDYAADVISTLLDGHPGPRHVRFGHGEHRRRVADCGGCSTRSSRPTTVISGMVCASPPPNRLWRPA